MSMKQVTFTEEPGATWVILAALVIEQFPIYFSAYFTWLVQRHIQTPLLHSYLTQTNTIAPATQRKRTTALAALKDHSLCAWRLAITDKLCSTGEIDGPDLCANNNYKMAAECLEIIPKKENWEKRGKNIITKRKKCLAGVKDEAFNGLRLSKRIDNAVIF